MKIRVFFSCLIVLGIAVALAKPAASEDMRILLRYKPVETQITDLKIVEVGVVKEILKSNQVQMENGLVFTLDNLRTPIYYEERAKDFMEKTFKGKTIGVYENPTMPEEGKLDPHSNEYVHAITTDGVWLEKELVGQGLAMVTSTENNRDLVEPLYKAEIRARAAHMGFWAGAEFAVKNADTIKGTPESFVIFEDVVDSVAYHNSIYAYSNFVDRAHKHTFTIVISKEYFGLFALTGKDMSLHYFRAEQWNKIRIRARGWVEIQDGIPVMTVTHPEQIEYPEGRPAF